MKVLVALAVGATAATLIMKNQYEIGAWIDDLLNPSPY
jgi:hypothetical protein